MSPSYINAIRLLQNSLPEDKHIYSIRVKHQTDAWILVWAKHSHCLSQSLKFMNPRIVWYNYENNQQVALYTLIYYSKWALHEVESDQVIQVFISCWNVLTWCFFNTLCGSVLCDPNWCVQWPDRQLFMCLIQPFAGSFAPIVMSGGF
jgi:hypothetical protein